MAQKTILARIPTGCFMMSKPECHLNVGWARTCQLTAQQLSSGSLKIPRNSSHGNNASASGSCKTHSNGPVSTQYTLNMFGCGPEKLGSVHKSHGLFVNFVEKWRK